MACHTAKIIKDICEEVTITVMVWTTQIPYLDNAEMPLKIFVNKMREQNIAMLMWM